MDIKTQILKEAEKKQKFFLIKDITEQWDCPFDIWSEEEVLAYRRNVSKVGAAPGISEIAEFTEDIKSLVDTAIVQPLRKELEYEVKQKDGWIRNYNEIYDENKSLQSQLSLSEGRVGKLDEQVTNMEAHFNVSRDDFND